MGIIEGDARGYTSKREDFQIEKENVLVQPNSILIQPKIKREAQKTLENGKLSHEEDETDVALANGGDLVHHSIAKREAGKKSRAKKGKGKRIRGKKIRNGLKKNRKNTKNTRGKPNGKNKRRKKNGKDKSRKRKGKRGKGK